MIAGQQFVLWQTSRNHRQFDIVNSGEGTEVIHRFAEGACWAVTETASFYGMTIWGNGVEIRDIRTVPASDRGFFSGRWRVIHGAYRIAEQSWRELRGVDKQLLRIKAVGLHAGTAILVGRAAGELWQLWILGTDYPIELCYPNNRSGPPKRQWKPGVRYRRMHIPRQDYLSHQGIRLTGLERTVVDICRFESFAQGLAAVESYLRMGNSPSALWKKWRELGNLHGKKKFVKVMKWARSKSESAAESLAKAQMIEVGVEMEKVQQQPTIVIRGAQYRPDFLYDSWLAIEINGAEKYSGAYGDAVHILRAERMREQDFLNEGHPRLSASWADLQSGQFIELLMRRIEQGR